MPQADGASKDPSPHQPIRRFDVFAEYTRQERREKGFPEDAAKGYGIWLAKVVASRRFGQKSVAESTKPAQQRDRTEEEPKFCSVGDELQTDETFDHDIIDRCRSRYGAMRAPGRTTQAPRRSGTTCAQRDEDRSQSH